MKAAIGAIAFVLVVTLAPAAKSPQTQPRVGRPPSATCFCLISYDDLTNKKTQSGVCKDLTAELGVTYTGLNPQKDANQTDCNSKCQTLAATYQGNPGMAACACAAGKPSGTLVRAWSAVGVKEYKAAQQIGVLINQPQVTKTTCTCPAGWTCNGCSPQVAGGVTTDGACKKVVCQPFSIAPFPPDGTQVGTWGFTWGNALVAWGTTANGGAPNCVTSEVSPAMCKF